MNNSFLSCKMAILLIVMSSNFLNGQNNYLENRVIKDNKILEDTGIKLPELQNQYDTLEVVDTFSIGRRFLHDIAWGGGFLWITYSEEFGYDSVFKVNPITKQVVDSFQIGDKIGMWSHGLIYDSSSSDEHHHLWIATGYSLLKLSVRDFKIIKEFDIDKNYAPHGMALLNDNIFINMDGIDSLKIFNIHKENFLNQSYYFLWNYLEFSYDRNDNVILWTTHYDLKFEERDLDFIYVIDFNKYKLIKKYLSPGPYPIGLTWDNESYGGPFIWHLDFYTNVNVNTNLIYKLKAPDILLEDTTRYYSGCENFVLSVYPNPFNNIVFFEICLPERRDVSVQISNLLGQRVLLKNFTEVFAGISDLQCELFNQPQGTYFYKLQAGSEVKTGKIMLINNWRY